MVGKRRPPREQRRGTTRSLYVYTHQSENPVEGEEGGSREEEYRVGRDECLLLVWPPTHQNELLLPDYLHYLFNSSHYIQ